MQWGGMIPTGSATRSVGHDVPAVPGTTIKGALHYPAGAHMQYLGMILFAATTGIAAFLLSQIRYPRHPGSISSLQYLYCRRFSSLSVCFERSDDKNELFQRVQFEAIAFAAVLVWLFTFSWGALESMHVVPRLPAYLVATAIVFLYGFGVCLPR